MLTVKESRTVSLAEILVGDYEVRTAEADPDLESLAASIRRDGLLMPLGVVQTEGGLRLVHGHRRYSACVMARLSRVRVEILEGSAGEMQRASIVENYHRKDVTPMERAAQIADAVASGAMTLEEVCEVFDRSMEWVGEQMAMMEWPADVQELVHRRLVAPVAGRYLARIEDDAYREFLLRQAAESGCTERVAQAWLLGWRSMMPVEQVAQEPVASPTGPARPVVPRSVCLGCKEGYAPDGLAMVWLCPGCLTALQGGAVVQRR